MATTAVQRLMESRSGNLYLDGAYVASAGELHDVVDPATEQCSGRYADATPGEVAGSTTSRSSPADATYAPSM